MYVAKKISTSILLFVLFVVLAISIAPTSSAWGEWHEMASGDPGEAAEAVSEPEEAEFVGPVLLSAESQTDEQTLAPTEGWEAYEGVEWKLDENKCLTIRPLGNQGIGSLIDLGSAPWNEVRNAVKTCKVEGRISVDDVGSGFYGYGNLEEVEGLSNFDTSKATDMSRMFEGCSSLTSLDFSNFNTSAVTDMGSMFYGCSSLISLDLSSFNTSAVTSFGGEWFDGMFARCSSLSSLDLSSFDTSKATVLSGMFEGCSSLTSLDLSSFDTSAVTDFGRRVCNRGMFSGCSALASLDLSSFDTSEAIDMSNMFEDCASLTVLNLSNFNTSKVTNMSEMFSGCASLKTLTMSNFDTSRVTDMSEMFSGCTSFESIDLSKFKTWLVTNMSGMFLGCSSLTSLDLSSFDTSAVIYFAYSSYNTGMFSGCSSLTSLDLSSFDTSKVTSSSYMFDPALKEIAVGEKFTLQSDLPPGKWYNSAGEAFATPAGIPVGVADTYTAAIPITSIVIEEPSTTLLDVGGSLQLEVSVGPADTTERDSLTWSSSNESVATVDENGLVTAVAYGYATISATDGEQYSSVRDSIQITVNKRVQGITLSEAAKVVKLSDGPFTLTATITPADSFNGAIAWSSSDTDVATVDANGRVTPKAVGEAFINASAGNLSAQCFLTVLASDEDVVPVESVTLDKSVASITGKGTVKLSATVLPMDATYRSIRWTSSNESVATVDIDGTVTSQGRGSAIITATSLDGKESASCQVTISNPPTSLQFSSAPSQVKIGQTAKFAVRGAGELPGATEDIAGLDWSLSDHGIASLAISSEDAAVTGVSVGRASLTATASYEGDPLSAVTDLEVIWADPESVDLSEAERRLVAGDGPFTLSASVAPESAAGTQVFWSSSDPEVATVDQDGVVSARKAGSATIFARAGAVSAQCAITVDAKGIVASEDSDADGYVLIADADAATELDGVSFRIKESERKGSADLNSALHAALSDASLLTDVYEMEFVEADGTIREWDDPHHVLTVHVAESDQASKLSDEYLCTVYYVDKDSEVIEPKNTWREGDDVVFETTHFSTYAMTSTPLAGEPSGDPVKNDTTVGGGLAKTGDALGAALDGAAAIALLGMISLAIVSVLRRRKDSQHCS